MDGPINVDYVLGDVSKLHGANPNAVFQVASQFNVLEFPTPDAVPENGVNAYYFDRTQGPACCIACGPGIVYRNYFAEVPVRDSEGN